MCKEFYKKGSILLGSARKILNAKAFRIFTFYLFTLHSSLKFVFGNPDHDQDPTVPLVQTQGAQADTIEELSKIVRDYIEKHNLGAGNRAGGKVWTEQNEYVGYISYNGRFWEDDNIRAF